MGPTSRYRFSRVERDSAGRVFLGPRPVYGYRALPDTLVHTVSEGETIHSIAAAYYAGLDRPEQFFWVIADFQPEPIRDVTIPLEPQRELYIPSLQVLEAAILSPNRSSDEEDDLG
jgi:hypothetical protein